MYHHAYLFLYYNFFCAPGVRAQDLALSRQALYHLSDSLALYYNFKVQLINVLE
jgi:hypothetical protein